MPNTEAGQPAGLPAFSFVAVTGQDTIHLYVARMNIIHTQPYPSPCGTLLLGSLNGTLCLCDWRGADLYRAETDRRIQHTLHAVYKKGSTPVIREVCRQLDEYFSGIRQTFDLPILFAGTCFQQTVWTELQRVPYGTTLSYAALAQRIGRPQAIRAVAAANKANALSIIVPCHRIVGSNGTLTGYAGGLPAKQYLLDLEKSHIGTQR